jgi:hypothetical protein
MRLLFFIVVFGSLSVMAADPATSGADSPKKRKLSAQELYSFYKDTAGRIVTDWTDMEKDTKVFRAFSKAGYVTVLSEGKMQDGEMVFRKAYKHVNDTYPDADKLMWYTYNGVDEEFFDNQNRTLLAQNFTLMQMQQFLDGEGERRFCAIWVKFDPRPEK